MSPPGLENRGTVLTLETQRQAAGVVPPFLLSNSGPRSKVDPRGFGGDDRNFLQRLGTKCGNASMRRTSLESLLMKALVFEKSRLGLGGIATYKLARLTNLSSASGLIDSRNKK